MKKHIYIVFFLLIGGITTPCLSQEKKINGFVKYSQLTAFADTTKPILIYTHLYFNSGQSLYKVGVIQNSNPQTQPTLPEHRRYGVYVDLLGKKMISRQSADSELVLVSDTLEQIDWKILPNKRKIGEMNCQLAQGLVRGRNYNAWFTLDVPVGVGPWKLQGLPGLIVEAKSLDNEVFFRFEEIKIPDDSTPITAILPNAKMKVLNEAEFLQQRKRNEDSFRKMLESRPDFEKGELTIKTTGIEVFAK